MQVKATKEQSTMLRLSAEVLDFFKGRLEDMELNAIADARKGQKWCPKF
jgi:hypothetical protein